MGCSPSSPASQVDQHDQKMLIQDFKIRKDPWRLESFEPGVQYDPWEGSVGKSSNRNKSVRIVSPKGSAGEEVSIVDLRSQSDVIKASLCCDNVFKNSECQTDQPEGVDFDWDLTDKIDNETQTSTSRADSNIFEPLDVIVQTDQRIVFTTKRRRGRLGDSDKAQKSSRVSASSQTSWDVTDQEIQVCLLCVIAFPSLHLPGGSKLFQP